MFKQARTVAFGWACGLAMGAMLYARAAQDPPQPSHPLDERQRREIQQLQHNIERLERELSAQKEQLAYVERNDFLPAKIAPPPSELALVLNITGSTAVVERGKRDGFRLKDKLVFVRRTEAGPIIIGFGGISELYDKDFLAWKGLDFGGIRPDDEVYIINRENARFSLIHARLWYSNPKKDAK